MSKHEKLVNIHERYNEGGEKQQRWNDMYQQVIDMQDDRGMSVDEGIRETVTALNLLGFSTRQSCEGHLERAAGAPWIHIEVEGTDDLWEKYRQARLAADQAEETNCSQEEMNNLYAHARELCEQAERPVLEMTGKLMRLLTEFYDQHHTSYDTMLTFRFGTRLESNGALLQDIVDLETREQKLKEYQDEMKEFTAFLKDKFFSA